MAPSAGTSYPTSQVPLITIPTYMKILRFKLITDDWCVMPCRSYFFRRIEWSYRHLGDLENLDSLYHRPHKVASEVIQLSSTVWLSVFSSPVCMITRVHALTETSPRIISTLRIALDKNNLSVGPKC